MTTPEKVAYLKGLAEGLGTDPASREGKLLTAVIDILEDLALDLQEVMETVDELEEGLDVVSDDLEDVEDILYGTLEDDEDSLSPDPDDDDDFEELDSAAVYYEARCPTCGEYVTFEESTLEKGGIQCPACGENLEFEFPPADAPAEEE